MSRFLMPRNTKGSKKRAENNKAHRQQVKAVERDLPVLRQYDTNKTGMLERDQLVKLLTELTHTSSAGEKPTDQEVDYILLVADRRHNGAINVEELPDAIAAWKSYQREKPTLDRFLQKHDDNQSGGLSKEQMAGWLKDINGGDDVTEEDLEYVWSFAHVGDGDKERDLSRVELAIALNLWVHHEVRAENEAALKAMEERRKAAGPKPFARFLMPRLTKMSAQRADASRFYARALQNQRDFLKKVEWSKYDSNTSGALERPQLRQFLTDYDFSTPKGVPPTEFEVDYILQVADFRRNGAINKDELENALTAWATYQEYKVVLDRVIAKYDATGDGGLTKAEVTSWLTELNGGVKVPDEEAELIMQSCDLSQTSTLQRTELLLALQTWFCGHSREAPPSLAAVQGGDAGGKPASGCCIAQ
eukprot:Hpha_TRINITY_DN16122_c1_g2::TRINITY_DN16122_c1_g2_i2::g.7276::m.7276